MRSFISEDTFQVRGKGTIKVVQIPDGETAPSVGDLVLIDSTLFEIRGVEQFCTAIGPGKNTGLLVRPITYEDAIELQPDTEPAKLETQADMTEKSIQIYTEAHSRMMGELKKVNEWLVQEENYDLLCLVHESQKAWRLFADKDTAIVAKLSEGGSIAPLMVNMRYAHWFNMRADDLSKILPSTWPYTL